MNFSFEIFFWGGGSAGLNLGPYTFEESTQNVILIPTEFDKKLGT
jgi:hypothetical protein